MRNLSGGTFEKQIRDSNFKLDSYGKSKSSSDKSNQTHSNKVGEQRDMIQKDFINYIRENNLDNGEKINNLMTNENVSNFLNERLEGLKLSSQETYIRGMSSLVNGLKENDIRIPCDKNTFDNKVNELKENHTPTNEIIHRSLETPKDEMISKLTEINEGSGLISNIQLDLGLRVSESYDLVNKFENVVNENNEIVGLYGKGGQEILNKELSNELVQKIQDFKDNNNTLPHQNTYNNHINKVEEGKSSHSMRYTYINNSINEKLESGNYNNMSEIKLAVSEEILHHREDIINNYISKM
ncbi:hypothetical protein [Poseidonibacter sp.]|uniref:hypothetical protein n=1 Tax=Poseidonibacter sp. TaxID=2321188 RepID=UPI003C76A88C